MCVGKGGWMFTRYNKQGIPNDLSAVRWLMALVPNAVLSKYDNTVDNIELIYFIYLKINMIPAQCPLNIMVAVVSISGILNGSAMRISIIMSINSYIRIGIPLQMVFIHVNS